MFYKHVGVCDCNEAEVPAILESSVVVLRYFKFQWHANCGKQFF